MIDWSLKKNWGYVAAILAVFLVAPHIIMSMPGFAEGISNSHAEGAARTAGQIYLLFVWFLLPLCGGIVALFHVLMGERFCPLLPIAAELSILTYLFRLGFTTEHLLDVLALSLSAVLILLMECFALLGHRTPGRRAGTGEALLAGAAQNYLYLAALFGCSFVPLAVDIISVLGNGVSGIDGVFRPLLLVPMVLALWILSGVQLKNTPLTRGGLLGALILYLVAFLPGMLRGAWSDLIYLAVGFGLPLLIPLIQWMAGRRRAEKGGAAG